MPARPMRHAWSFPRFFQAGAAARPFLLAGLLAASLAACLDAPPPPPDLPAMRFEVDTTRLGPAVEAAGLRVRPPRAWEALSEAERDTLRPVSLADTTRRPFHVFMDREGGGLLSLAAPGLPDTLAFEALADAVAAHLAARFPSDTLRQVRYRTDSLRVAQFALRPAGEVLLAALLVPPAGPPIELAFRVPEARYPEAVRAIESSIGSAERVK